MTASLTRPFTPATAPESFDTCVTQCSWCSGTGQLEAVLPDGELTLVDCEDCGASGVVGVLDVPLCEFCQTHERVAEGLCRQCIQDGLDAAQDELSPTDYAAELIWAREVAGWL